MEKISCKVFHILHTFALRSGMLCRLLLWLFLGLLAVVADATALGNDIAAAQVQLDKSRLGLLNSTWPSDHADVSRSKFTLNAGLPRGFHPQELKLTLQKDLIQPQWIYTGGKNSEFLYVLGGVVVKGCYVAKLDSVSLEILQEFQLPPALYIGGLLIHANGHVYAVQANRIFAFWNGDLTNSSMIKIPHNNLNGNLVQTNGMLVTQDGLLVVKQWNYILEDIFFLFYLKDQLARALVALFVIFSTFFYMKFSGSSKIFAYENMKLQNLIPSFLLGFAMAVFFGVLVFMCFFRYLLGSYDPVSYIVDSLVFQGGGGGELKLIDPLSLEVVADAWFPERCSFPRMTMTSVVSPIGEMEDAIILLGDEHIYQYRWNPKQKKLYVIPQWSRRYRIRGDGSFPGTGPGLYDNKLYFTDNTFPINLKHETFSVFSMPILHLKEHNDSVMAYESCFMAASEKEDDGEYDRFLATW